MKKYILWRGFCLMCFVAILCASVTAVAGIALHIDEVGLSLTIPSEYEIFTHGTEASDPRFTEMGLDGKSMEQMLSTNLYLSAIAKDFTSEITVTMAPNKIYEDYNLLGQTTVKVMIDSIAEDLFADNGIELIEYSLYQHKQALFVEYRYKNPATASSAIQYSTIYDSKDINITFWSYDGDLTYADQKLAKSIVEEIVFDKEPQKSPTVSNTSSFIYTDSTTGASFTVPENWEKRELSQEREFVDASFASVKDRAMTILYGSTDLWERATEEMRQGFSRSDLTMSAITKEDIAAMNGVEIDQVRLVNYNGVQFYQTNLAGEHNAYGIDWFIEATQLTHIDNGWMFQFQFSGTEESEFYSDFISLINSVHFSKKIASDVGANTISSSNTSFGAGSSVNNNETPVDNSEIGFNVKSIVLSLVVTIAIYSAPVFIYRYAIRKRPMEEKKAKIFSIVYAIIGFIIMSVVVALISGDAASGGGLLLWSFINYKILSGGRDKTKRIQYKSILDETGSSSNSANDLPLELNADVSATINTNSCDYCGAIIPEGNAFCHKCGYKLKGE